MPTVKLLDSYIERSTSLLEAKPVDTHVSITYHTKPPKPSTSKKDSKPASSSATTATTQTFISFKTYNPESGACYTYKTSKTKDLSRILSALGPRGVQFTKTRKAPHDKITKPRLQAPSTQQSKSQADKSIKKKSAVIEEKYVVDGKGFASLMSNKPFKNEEAPVVATDSVVDSGSVTPAAVPAGDGAAANNAGAASSKKKKNKKKKSKK